MLFRSMPGPAPYGEGAPGRGYYGNMSNPGVRSDVRNEMGTGAGAPRLRYEPVGEGGGGVPAVRGGGGAIGPAGGSYGIQALPSNLPMMARGDGRGLVPREIAGEYSEVQGIPYYGQAAAPGAGEEAAWWNGDLGGVTGGGAARGRGVPYGTAATMAGPALVPLAVGAGGEEDRQRYTLPEMPIGRPRHQLADMQIGRPRHQLEDMHIGQAPVYATPLYGEETSQPLAPQKVEKRGKRQQPPMDIRPKAQKEQPQQESGWAPNLNYDVTRALDQLFGQNRAEEGRRAQQYWESHPFQG